jgi:hypothetical protein
VTLTQFSADGIIIPGPGQRWGESFNFQINTGRQGSIQVARWYVELLFFLFFYLKGLSLVFLVFL